MCTCSPQLHGMLRKNWILTKRNAVELLREILIPVFYLSVMIVVRILLKGSEFPEESDYGQGNWNSKWWSFENVAFWLFDGRQDALPDNITVAFAPERSSSISLELLQLFSENFQLPLQYESPQCFEKNSSVNELQESHLYSGNTATTFAPNLPTPGREPPPLLFCPVFKIFNTSTELEINAVNNESSIYFGIVFSELPSPQELSETFLPKLKEDNNIPSSSANRQHTISYTIRMNHSLVIGEISQAQKYNLMYTDITGMHYLSPTPSNQTRQWLGLFSAVQLAVDDALLNMYSCAMPHTNCSETKQSIFVESSMRAVSMPTPAFVLDTSATILAFLVPAWLSNIFMLQIRGSLQRILEDKEHKYKVGLKMIGLSETVYWLAWAILLVGKGLIIVTILTAATKIGDIYPQSNSLLIFGLYFTFSIVCCAYSFLATAFFSKARLGAIVGYLIFLFSMLSGIALEYVDSVSLKQYLAIWPPIAFFQERSCSFL